MNAGIRKLWYCWLIIGIMIPAAVPAQFRSADTVSENRDQAQTVKAKREIITLLFADIFRGEKKETVNLSTKNLPKQLLSNFPKFKNVSTRFVVDDETAEDLCPFVFHSFVIAMNKATLSFGNCRDGLGYEFEKLNGKWKFALSATDK